MPEVWIIMGDAQVGKSSAIRALTGAFKSDYTNVQTAHGRLTNIFVQIRSLQENRISPERFIKDHRNDQYILLSLRINQAGGYPNGLSYIREFNRNGWVIKGIAVLGTNILPYNLPQGLPNPLFIPNSQNTPANEVAYRIRQVWNWL